MEKIRGKSLQEWKEYCSSENVPVKTMKYITCLEERIKQLTLTDVGCTFSFDKIEITENKQQEFIEKWLAEQRKRNKR